MEFQSVKRRNIFIKICALFTISHMHRIHKEMAINIICKDIKGKTIGNVNMKRIYWTNLDLKSYWKLSCKFYRSVVLPFDYVESPFNIKFGLFCFNKTFIQWLFGPDGQQVISTANYFSQLHHVKYSPSCGTINLLLPP